MKAYVSVHDDRNLGEFLRWMERNGFEVYTEDSGGEYDVVVVNLPPDLPRSEKRLLKEGRFRDVGILAGAALRYEDVLPVCDPDDYELVMELFERAGDVPKSVRRILSMKALLHALEYMSRVHTRLSELFGMVEYVHHVWKVKLRILENSYTEEYLTDLPESVFFGKENPLIPLYVFALDLLPKGGTVVFNRAVPIYASLGFEPVEGEVLVYNGEIHDQTGHDLVVARGGAADVISKPKETPTLTVESEGIGYRVEVESGIGDVERLALAFVSLSPMRVVAVFKDGRLSEVGRKIEGIPDVLSMPQGDVLAVNFHLEIVRCDLYSKVIAPNASEKVRKLCGSKLLLRKL